MSKAETRCASCGGPTDRGRFQARTREGPARLSFVIPGVETSINPLRAFRQGLAGEPDDRSIDLDAMGGLLCRVCGRVELYAWFADELPEL